MKIFSRFNSKAAEILKKDGIGVIPTDTIYGIVGSAFSRKAVSRIYRLRRRRPDKPMIILISSKKELKHFGISLDKNTNRILDKFWSRFRRPALRRSLRQGKGYGGQAGKVSVILRLRDKRPRSRTSSLRGRQETRDKFKYLHRGTKTLAFRLPAKRSLFSFLKKTGPLVAPSANIEGQPPAKTIKEAQKYFSDEVDFYVDGGKLFSKPSTLIKSNNGKISIVRQGATRLPKN